MELAAQLICEVLQKSAGDNPSSRASYSHNVHVQLMFCCLYEKRTEQNRTELGAVNLLYVSITDILINYGVVSSLSVFKHLLIFVSDSSLIIIKFAAKPTGSI